MTVVREATPDDVVPALNVLDGAALETNPDAVRTAVERGDALVAASEVGDGTGRTGTVLGALVLDGDRVVAVAVRRRRRGQGIGTALVEAAADRRDRLTAAFDADVRPFYERLGFSIETAASGRYRGVRKR